MVRKSKQIGSRLISKALVKLVTLMAILLQASIKCHKRQVQAYIYGVVTNRHMKVISKKTYCKDRQKSSLLKSNHTLAV